MQPQPSLLQPQNAVRGTCFALATFLSTALIGVVVKWLPADTPSTTIGFFQFCIALLLTCPWALKRAPTLAQPGGLQNLKTRRLALHLLRSISGLFPHLLFYVAIVYVPLVDANLLLSAAPIWVPLLLLVCLRQVVVRALWVSTLVGLIGVGCILHPHLQSFNRGAIYGLASGIMLATALITVRVLARTEPPARQLFYYALVSTLICFPLMVLKRQPMPVQALLLLCSVGLLLFSQQFFLVQALRYIDAGLLSPMSYFTIVFAGLFGWLLWSETPDIRTFIGVVLVLCSSLLAVLTGRRQEAAEMRSSTGRIICQQGSGRSDL
jgi:drug/metabolite transporter (DMT)-like permease